MRNRSVTLAVLVMVCVMVAAVPVVAQDWPGADNSGSTWPGTESKPAPAPAPAQAPAASAEPSAPAAESPAPAAAAKPASSAPRKSTGGSGAAGGLLALIIGYIAQIGGLFGNVAGFRIGGTTGTAIITLIVAQVLKDKAPDWVRYVLMAGGGTMAAGSGANIVEAVMRGLV